MRYPLRYTTFTLASLFAFTISPAFGALIGWEQNPLTQNVQEESRPFASVGNSSEIAATSAFQLGTVAQPDLGAVLEQVSVGQHGEQEMEAPAAQSGGFSLAGDAQPQPSFGTRLDAWEATYNEQFPSASDLSGYQFPSVADAASMNPGGAQTAVPAVPEFAALFPILGLLAAIFATEVLRRRRVTRRSALGA